MEDLMKWIIGSSKITDWLNLILMCIITVPVLISLNDRYQWLSKIKKMYSWFKEKLKGFVNMVKLYFLKRKVIKYLKKTSSSDASQLNIDKRSIDVESGGIRLTSYSGNSFLIRNKIITKLFPKYNLKKWINEIPIGITIILIEEMTSNKLNPHDFFKYHRLSRYEYLLIDGKRTIKRRCPDVNCGEVIEVDIKPSDVRIN